MTKEILSQEQFLLFKQVREKKGSSRIEARNKLVEMNKGLVGFVIKRFFPSVIKDPLVEYDDAFGEGLLGLFRAVDKFDWNFGAAFSTYATFWIKQAIWRFLINQATSSIRIPINVYWAINKMNKKIESLQQKLGRAPIAQEMAEEMEMDPELIERLMALRSQSERHTSLDKAITDDEESSSLCEFITYPNQPNPLEIMIARQGQKAFREKIKSLVEAGPFKEKTKKAFYLRSGLLDGEHRILREVGKMMGGVTRERIRQREEKVLNYLRQPEIFKQIKDYMAENLLSYRTLDTPFAEYGISLPEKMKLYPKIIKLVALLHGLEKATLLSRYRVRGEINQARMMVAYVCKELGLSFSDVGKKMGLKPYTLYNRRCSFKKRMRKNPILRREIFLIGKALSQEDSQAFLCGRCQESFPLEEMRDIHQRKYCRDSLEGVKCASRKTTSEHATRERSVGYSKQADPLEMLIVSQDLRAFREKIKNLVGSSPFPEKIKKSFYLRFGFKNGKFHTLQEVGDIVGGVTREMVRQRKEKVLNYLRQPEILKQIKEYLPQDISSEQN